MSAVARACSIDALRRLAKKRLPRAIFACEGAMEHRQKPLEASIYALLQVFKQRAEVPRPV